MCINRNYKNLKRCSGTSSYIPLQGGFQCPPFSLVLKKRGFYSRGDFFSGFVTFKVFGFVGVCRKSVFGFPAFAKCREIYNDNDDGNEYFKEQ